MEIFIRYNKKQDFISMAAAIVCLIHCVALPIFFSTLPFLGFEILENIWLETATVLIALFVGGIAIWKGYTYYHRRLISPILFLLGLLFMIAGNFWKEEIFEMITKISGAIAMITAHTINWKSIRKAGGHKHAEK